jgi:two-component system, chemotaxis family, CheB/CheR fusion protein
LQIFASDLDPEAIDNARKGLYSSNIAADVPTVLLSRYFTVEADGYRVIPAIRDMVMFATHNIIKDPPFSRLDIISCRNILIYMELELKKKLTNLFNFGLKSGGILVLGSSETLGRETLGFEEIDFRLKIYQRTSESQIFEPRQFLSTFNQKSLESSEFPEKPKAVENIQTLADQLLLRRFVPASVLINPKGDIIYMTGHIGKYLEPVAGKANWNIYSMAREGLRKKLSGVLHRSLQNYDEHILHNIKVGAPEDRLVADVKVQRIDSQDSLKDMIMVIFTNITAQVENELNLNNNKLKSRGQLKEMKIQLLRSEEDLQVMREELQISQEEMKFTNEELLSTNEELLSTNDELNSSMQNMQSLNEELHVLNFELQSNISDFVVVNDDLKNLLNSTGIATLFLDKALNVRKFTDQVTNMYKLRKTDIGRPLNELVSDLQYPEMENHARQVLQDHTFIENEIATNDGRWFNVRIMPYRTRDNRIDGLVLTFTNITLAKKAQQTLTFSETRYRRLFESAKDGILILDAETGMIVDVNPFLIEMLGYSKEQFTEKSIWEIGFLN